jgi:hypothetical protein
MISPGDGPFGVALVAGVLCAALIFPILAAWQQQTMVIGRQDRLLPVPLLPRRDQTINSPSDYAAQLLSDLGLSLPPAVTALRGDQGAQISLERLDTLDADVLIMAYAPDDLRTSLESNPVFRAAPAVCSGHYLPVSVDGISAVRLPSMLSIPYGLDQLEPGLGQGAGRMPRYRLQAWPGAS